MREKLKQRLISRYMDAPPKDIIDAILDFYGETKVKEFCDYLEGGNLTFLKEIE